MRALEEEIVTYIRDGEPGAPPGVMFARSVKQAAPPASHSGSANVADQRAFLDAIAPAARTAAERLGVAPELVAAHAALESGWGRHSPGAGLGVPSHNLFGIKAGPAWKGAVATAATTEFDHGQPLRIEAGFRSYPDTGAAFQDYATTLLGQPRFRAALGHGSDSAAFAAGLARGGYATDPDYASKLMRVATRVRELSE